MPDSNKFHSPAVSIQRQRRHALALPDLLIVIGYLTLFIMLDITVTSFETSFGGKLWYLPAGIGLALLLICGVRYAFLLLVGILISEFFFSGTHFPLWVLVMVALIITLIYSLAAIILRQGVKIDWQIKRLRDLVWLVSVGFGASLLVAVLQLASFALADLSPWSDFWSGLFSLWFGQAIGLIFLAPFLLVHGGPRLYKIARKEGGEERHAQGATPSRPARWYIIESLGQTVTLVLILWLVFYAQTATPFNRFYLCFLPLIWIALRRGLAGATIGILAVNLGVIVVGGDISLELQIFMLVFGVLNLLLGGVVTERKQIAAERDSLLAVQHERRHLAETLTDVALALTSKTSPEAVLNEILRQVQRLVPYRTAHIMLLEGDNLRIAYWQGYRAVGSEQWMANLVQPLREFPLDSQVIWSRKPIVIADVRQEARWVIQSETAWVRSNLMLPICVGDRSLGLLRLDADFPQAFSTEDAVVLEPLANAAAIALENARLYDQARQEIADRKRAEGKLRQRNRELTLLNTAIDQAAEGVAITNGEGLIVYTNPAFEGMTGYSREDTAGQNMITLLQSDKHRAAFYEGIWSTIKAGQVWSGRIVNKKKDDTLFTGDVTITPVHNEEGTIVNYVSVQRDVTRELQLEEQYHRAEKMDAIGRLTGGIVHDFNNLLTVINGFAETLQFRLGPDSPHQDLADRIRHTVRRATNLSDQLMAFSRNEPIRPQVLDLNVIVNDIGSMLQPIIGNRIRLKTDLASNLWPVKVDSTQTEQVIVNLAVNARDAMPDGGQLIIKTANVVSDDQYVGEHFGIRPGRYVLLSVSDNGTGMSDEVKTHIFEPFYTTKEEGKGTGLGLATVFRIVEESEGQILVDSELGRGTTFKIYLPQVEAPVTSQPQRIRAGDLPQGTETVLLVEDEPAVRDLAVRLLRRQGYTVLEATTDTEVFRWVREYPEEIHLLLTDMVMPELSGKALAERVRALHPTIKVLLMSGHREKIFTGNGGIDANPFIPKPFSAADLILKVRTVLDN